VGAGTLSIPRYSLDVPWAKKKPVPFHPDPCGATGKKSPPKSCLCFPVASRARHRHLLVRPHKARHGG